MRLKLFFPEGFTFSCSRRIALQDAKDVSFAIFSVREPSNVRDCHLREDDCPTLGRNFSGSIVYRRHIDGADIGNDGITIDWLHAPKDGAIDARFPTRPDDNNPVILRSFHLVDLQTKSDLI